MSLQTTLPQVIAAVGGLGTAAFGLVDASKPIFGINNIGFSGIQLAVASLTPPSPAGSSRGTLSPAQLLSTLHANWVNGNDIASQKAIAKSLIKLSFNPGNAAAIAAATGIDPVALTAVAANISAGAPLTSAQSDVYARFDFILTALLDDAYQHADQSYRNGTRLLATAVAIALAVAGGIVLDGSWGQWIGSGRDIAFSLLVGILATPLAPIAKDVASAIATAVETMQLVKK